MKYFRIIGLIIGIFTLFQSSTCNAGRIVSLAPSLTKNIYFLDAQEQLVGCTSYCTEALADNKTVVASAIKVNIEKTVSLLPDLVLATTITPAETIESLEKLGVKVEIFPTPKSYAEICSQFNRLGELTNKAEEAESIINISNKKVDELKKLINTTSTPEIFCQIGADPIFTVLPNTFMNDYITLSGGRNIADDLTKGTMTRESVLSRDPAYIFIVTMGIVGEEEKNIWEKFPSLKAAEDQHIFIIDAEKACSPTPITFVETFETIINLMNQ